MAKRAIYFEGIQRMLEEGSHTMERGVGELKWPPASSVCKALPQVLRCAGKRCRDQGLTSQQGLAGEQRLTKQPAVQWPGLPKDCLTERPALQWPGLPKECG